MKVIVITGSTRGIGYGLADSFLNEDCSVMISGRTSLAVETAVDNLSTNHKKELIAGHCCDVRDYEAVKELWKVTVDRFGKVDIWINNAGINHSLVRPWQLPASDIESIIDTNLLGVMYGSNAAVEGMLEQGYGAIYNMEGMGSDGRMHDGLTLYGMTKYGLKYLTDALVKETKDSPIIIGALRPGMVVTDLIVSQYKDHPDEWQQVKRIFNIIADRVENVAPRLVDRMLLNQVTGKRINYNSNFTILSRFLLSPFSKRDVFGDSDL